MSLFLNFSESVYNDAVAEVERQNDRGSVVVAASLLESILIDCIKTRFKKRNKQIEGQFIKGYGPLASFRAKIDLAFFLGVFNVEAHKNVLRIKDLRNKMAHEIKPLDFSSQEIIDQTDLLPSPRQVCLSWKSPSDWFRSIRSLDSEDRAEADRIIASIAGPAAASADNPRQRFMIYVRHRILALQLASCSLDSDKAIEFIWRDRL